MTSSLKTRGWTFTLFRDMARSETTWLRWIKHVEEIECVWMVFQTELSPTEKKLHLQGAVWFKTPRTMAGTKKRFPGMPHLEPAKGTPAQSETYCTKMESRATEKAWYSFTKGERPQQGTRGDLADLLVFARTHTDAQCWEEYGTVMARAFRAVGAMRSAIVPRQSARPNVVVYWGPTGTGKSHAAHEMAQGGPSGEEPYYVMPTPPSASATPWIDGYLGEANVILEDFSGEINYRIFLRMLDQYPNKMQVKGSMVEFAPKRIIISSNLHPKDWYPQQEIWGSGPLWRRLESDDTGLIVEKKDVYRPVNGFI